MKKILLSPWTATITLLLLLCIRVLDYSFIESVRLRYFDTLLTSKQVEQSEKVYVVNIDEKTIEKNGQFPFPRNQYSKIINDIFAHGAGLVVFNVYMPDRDRFGFDDELAKTLKKYPVVLPQMGDTEKSSIQAFRPGMSELGQPATDYTIDYPGIKPNTQKLNNAVQSAGVANVFPEIDGVVRRVPMVISSDGRLYPSIALESIRMAAGDPSFQIKSSEAGIEAVRVPNFRTI
jgi:adenylate cyclase